MKLENWGGNADTDGVKLRVVLLLIATCAAGCLWTPKPYTNDPLVRHRRAVLGDPAQESKARPWAEPIAPALPADPTP